MGELAYPRLCVLFAQKATRLSQAMHNAAFRSKGLPFIYSAVSTSDTERAIESVRVLGIRGASLTIPHKELAIPLLDSLSSEAQAIGAVNTVVNDGERLFGENTDWIGVVKAFEEAGISIAGKSVFVIGAGGAARGIVYALQNLRAGSINVTNRTIQRAEELAQNFQLSVTPFDQIKLDRWEVVVNTVPAEAGILCADQLTGLHRDQVIFDAVTGETELTREAARAGAKVILGTRMLLFQAVRQFELFTETSAPVDVMDGALQLELSGKSSIPTAGASERISG